METLRCGQCGGGAHLRRKRLAERTAVGEVAQVLRLDDRHVAEVHVQDEGALLREPLEHEHAVQERVVEGRETQKTCACSCIRTS